MSIRAVILAGGQGRRLLPLTAEIPKPLVVVGDMPILEILIRQLTQQGFDRLTIAVGHLAGQIQHYCGSGTRWDIRIDYVVETAPLGTVGCLGLIDTNDDERVLLINGDTLTDLNMAEVYAEHLTSDALTLCAHPASVPVDFGVLEADGDYLTAYVEKPELKYRVSMGVNVVSTWVIRRYIPAGRRLDTPDLVKQLLAAGDQVRVRETSAFWLDLGRIGDLEAGQAAFRASPTRFLPG